MTMIQIRNVPEDLHRRLKARAAQSGMSLSDFLLDELRRLDERPTVAEFRARLERRTPVTGLPFSAVDVIRADRDSR